MSSTQVTHYQGFLLDQPHTQFCKAAAIHLGILLSDADPADLLCDCPEGTSVVQSVRPDLTDVLLQKVEVILYTDGESLFKVKSGMLGL